jgi:hypothetical protein
MKALQKWRRDFLYIWSTEKIGGLERLVALWLVVTRLVSVSWWLRTPFGDPASGAPRSQRDMVVDTYVVGFLLLLAYLLFRQKPVNLLAVCLGAYAIFELYMTLFRILLLGKHSGMNAPTASFERSLILLSVNAFEVVLGFGLFYAYILCIAGREALLQSALVFGTVGYPPASRVALIVVTQVFLDVILIVFFIGTFAGQVGLFRRGGSDPDDNLLPLTKTRGTGQDATEPRRVESEEL